MEILENRWKKDVMKDQNLTMEKVINNLKIPKNPDQVKHV